MATLDERRLPCSATVRAEADFVPVLRYVLGTRASLQQDGLLRVRGPSIEILAAQLADFAEHIGVLKPEEGRVQLARLGSHSLAATDASKCGKATFGLSRVPTLSLGTGRLCHQPESTRRPGN